MGNAIPAFFGAAAAASGVESAGGSCGEGPVSDRDRIAVMPAVPASIARWAAIGRQNRRVSGRGKDNAAAGSA